MSRRGAVRAVLGCALLVAAPSAPRAEVVCQRRSGVLVARPDRCRKKEVRVPLDVAGPPGPAGPPGDPGPPAVAPSIRDAAGALVGPPVIVFDDNADRDGWFALRRRDDRILVLPVGPEGFRSSGALWFAEPGCTGPPLVDAERVNAFVTNLIVIGRTGYYARGEGTPSDARSKARGLDPSTCQLENGVFVPPNLCCYDQTEPLIVSEPVAVVLDSFGFTPPFHLEGAP